MQCAEKHKMESGARLAQAIVAWFLLASQQQTERSNSVQPGDPLLEGGRESANRKTGKGGKVTFNPEDCLANAAYSLEAHSIPPSTVPIDNT